MWVVLTAEEQFARSCDDCEKTMYRNRRPVPRPPGMPTPCRECPKIPPGYPPSKQNRRYAADMTPEIAAVWAFYKTCKAVGSFPKDELVAQCAARIMSAEEKAALTWQGRNVREGMGSVVGDLIQLTTINRRR